jgi:DNA-binding MarR family transcriptional regulator
VLDGAVGATYEEAGLRYRPRYTPVMRVLMAQDAASIGSIAAAAGITQPAATQTVALMIKEGLVFASAGPEDGRQRLIQLTEQGRSMLPAIQRCWQATAGAAASLDADLPFPCRKYWLTPSRRWKANRSARASARRASAWTTSARNPSPP